MQRRTALLACLLGGLVMAGTATALSEFGIEGMGVVSTAASEVRAGVSADGRRIVWGSPDRSGGAGGWDLWQATLRDGRWQDPRPVPINSATNDSNPMFSADGRWLYFISSRKGGHGGGDLYRAAVLVGGGFGPAVNLGPSVNRAGDEWAPTPSRDGQQLLFASDSFGGAGGHDLFVARWNGKTFVQPRAVPGVNSGADEFDAAWLGDGATIVFARSENVDDKAIQLFVAHCDGARYVGAAPLKLSFNSPDARTHAPTLDWNKPGELLVTGVAKAPRAGKLDIYRMKAPAVSGKRGCF